MDEFLNIARLGAELPGCCAWAYRLTDNLTMNAAVLNPAPPSGSSTEPSAAQETAAPFTWQTGFAALGPAFYTRLNPEPLPAPYWVGRSGQVAQRLGLTTEQMNSANLLEALTGSLLLPDSNPLASVYSGHQFGQWAGQLGDGRAILLGEALQADDGSGGGLEIQLKGAGRTPYSRMGDGRAVLRSSIREFLGSEAMAGLGIPTSRALCVTGSDARVRREEIETAAVVTRVAPSFIRFGHFEHFSYNEKHDELRQLADYVIRRYYPECLEEKWQIVQSDIASSATETISNSDDISAQMTQWAAWNPYARLLQRVSEKTAAMVAQWQSVGFCHGVMNTDNMSILGLTIDYGPFQFMDAYVPGHICNHSDTGGRYAFNKQPNIAYWNLYALGQALLPLIGEQEVAVAALESYKTVFPAAFEGQMRRKLGLPDVQAGDRSLIENILKLLAQDRVDFTIFWRQLSRCVADGPLHLPLSDSQSLSGVRDLFLDRAKFDDLMTQYSERIVQLSREQIGRLMFGKNPKYVLRNHLGEEAIQKAKLKDFSGVAELLKILENPFEEHPDHEAKAGFPPDWAAGIEISCSS